MNNSLELFNSYLPTKSYARSVRIKTINLCVYLVENTHNIGYIDPMRHDVDPKMIKEAIEAKGLKLKFVAESIGVSGSTLSAYLNRSRNLGKPATILLLQFLGISHQMLKKNAS